MCSGLYTPGSAVSMPPVPPTSPKYLGGGELNGAWPSSYQPAGSASLFLEGAGGEGELGWLWQFSGGDFFCVCVCVLGFCLFVWS